MAMDRSLARSAGHWVFREVDERDCPDETAILAVTIGRGVIRARRATGRQLKEGQLQPGHERLQGRSSWRPRLQQNAGLAGRGRASPASRDCQSRVHRAASAYTIEREFFHYLLRTPASPKRQSDGRTGISSDQWSLRAEHFKMIWSPVPPDDEQGAIVRFLDHADRRIRSVNRDKQKLIALLNEQKQVVIHRAVTRGLDPNISLKPRAWTGSATCRSIGTLQRSASATPSALGRCWTRSNRQAPSASVLAKYRCPVGPGECRWATDYGHLAA